MSEGGIRQVVSGAFFFCSFSKGDSTESWGRVGGGVIITSLLTET